MNFLRGLVAIGSGAMAVFSSAMGHWACGIVWMIGGLLWAAVFGRNHADEIREKGR